MRGGKDCQSMGFGQEDSNLDIPKRTRSILGSRCPPEPQPFRSRTRQRVDCFQTRARAACFLRLPGHTLLRSRSAQMTSIRAPILGYLMFANLEAPTFHHELSASTPLREPSFLRSTASTSSRRSEGFKCRLKERRRSERNICCEEQICCAQ